MNKQIGPFHVELYRGTGKEIKPTTYITILNKNQHNGSENRIHFPSVLVKKITDKNGKILWENLKK